MKFTIWRRTVLCAMAMATLLATSGGVHAVGVAGQGDWESTLRPRDLDGNFANGPEAFYDTTLNITWLRNADVNGLMNWATAVTWASSLDVNGVSGWRLPMMTDTGAPGCNQSNNGTDCGYNVQTDTSEMAHLWYVTLGNKAYVDTSGAFPQPGSGLTNTGDFVNFRGQVGTLETGHYWTGLAANTATAWAFLAYRGFQAPNGKSVGQFALAVHPGDVGVPAIPEPATYALMALGLVVVAMRGRRRVC